MSEFIDGRRWPARPDSSAAPEVAPRSDDSDQRQSGAALPDFPGFDVYPGYAMHAESVALHFPLAAVPALAALFPQEAEKIHAAALDVEQEAEWEQDRLRERQLTGGGA